MMRLIETQVDGSTWSMNTLGATVGLEAFGTLTALVAPGVAGLGSAFDVLGDSTKVIDHSTGNILESTINKEHVAGAIAGIMNRMADPKVGKLIKTLMTGLKKDAKTVDFDNEFSGNYGVLSKLVWWSIEENFGSFFLGSPLLQGIAQRAKAKIGSSS